MSKLLRLPHTPGTPPQHRPQHRRTGCAGYTVPGTPCLLLPVAVDDLHGLPLCVDHAPTTSAPRELFDDVERRLRNAPPTLLASTLGNLGIEHTGNGIRIHFQPNQEQPFLLWWDSRSEALSEPVCQILEELRQCLV